MQIKVNERITKGASRVDVLMGEDQISFMTDKETALDIKTNYKFDVPLIIMWETQGATEIVSHKLIKRISINV